MIVYGTEILTDLNLPLYLPEDAEIHYTVKLVKASASIMRGSITCGMPFSQAHGVHGRRIYFYSDRIVDSVEEGQPFCYEVKDVVQFFWVSGESTIYYIPGNDGNEELVGFWFLHIFLPLYATLENKFETVHGSAVEVNDSPVIFFAPSMGGKSTLTKYFIKQGHTLVADDKIPILQGDGFFLIGNSHPYCRPFRKHETLGVYVKKCATMFKRVYLSYVLFATGADAGVSIDEVRGQEKFSVILPSFLFPFPFLKKRRLTYISKMLNTMRLFRITVPWDLRYQEQVYKAICEHSREL